METDGTGGPGRPQALGKEGAHTPGCTPSPSTRVASQEGHLDLRRLRFSSHWRPRRSPTGGCAHLQSQHGGPGRRGTGLDTDLPDLGPQTASRQPRGWLGCSSRAGRPVHCPRPWLRAGPAQSPEARPRVARGLCRLQSRAGAPCGQGILCRVLPDAGPLGACGAATPRGGLRRSPVPMAQRTQCPEGFVQPHVGGQDMARSPRQALREAKCKTTEIIPATCSSDRADMKLEINNKENWRIHKSTKIQQQSPEQPVEETKKEKVSRDESKWRHSKTTPQGAPEAGRRGPRTAGVQTPAAAKTSGHLALHLRN